MNQINNMEAFKERLIEEYNELNDKLTKLENFIYLDNEKFLSLSEHQQDLMLSQYYFMQGYRHCLDKRINLLISKEELDEYRELDK